MVEKTKTPCRWSKISLHKNFKLVLEQNVTKQTYPKISCRSQKCLVQSKNQQFCLVNWVFSSNVFRQTFFGQFQTLWFLSDWGGWSQVIYSHSNVWRCMFCYTSCWMEPAKNQGKKFYKGGTETLKFEICISCFFTITLSFVSYLWCL